MLKRLISETADVLRDELKKGKHVTAFDAETMLNIDLRNAREYLKVLHVAGEAHITGWRRDARVGPWTPIYAWGKGMDAAKPRPLRKIWVRD